MASVSTVGYDGRVVSGNGGETIWHDLGCQQMRNLPHYRILFISTYRITVVLSRGYGARRQSRCWALGDTIHNATNCSTWKANIEQKGHKTIIYNTQTCSGMKEPNDGVERLAIRDRYANTIHTTSATPADQHLSRHTICVYGANRHTSQRTYDVRDAGQIKCISRIDFSIRRWTDEQKPARARSFHNECILSPIHTDITCPDYYY